MNNKNDIKKYKLFLLQKRYEDITNLILNLQNHINFIHKNNYINQLNRNVTLGKIFDISKNLNTKYNNYINNNLEKKNDSKYNQLFKKLNKINKNNENKKFNMIRENQSIFNINENPLELTFQKLLDIINDYGYNSLKELVKNKLNDNFNIIDDSLLKLLNELEDLVVPLNISFYDVNESKNYYWRIPNEFDENDYFDNMRELWIKNPVKKNNYLKINLFFKIDLL